MKSLLCSTIALAACLPAQNCIDAGALGVGSTSDCLVQSNPTQNIL